jgi:RNA polymerase sigma-70 factor (ECF subfamily)
MEMKLKSRQDELYEQAASEYKHALERLAQVWEFRPDKQRDLLQDIHLALWQSFDRFEGRCSTRTWVYRVAHNAAVTYALRERRVNAALTHSIDDVISVADGSSPDRQLDLDRLLAWIRLLKPLDRQLIVLYLEELDAESIGEITGLSPGNVRVHIHRIKKALALRFQGGTTDERE